MWLRCVRLTVSRLLPIRRSVANAAKPEACHVCPTTSGAFSLEDAVSRDEIIAVIQKHSKKLGRTVQLTELVKSTKISRLAIRTHFGNYTKTLRACGLEGQGYGYRLSVEDLFLDWAKVVRKLGTVPTVADFELHGKHSYRSFGRVFATWKDIPSGMIAYAKRAWKRNGKTCWILLRSTCNPDGNAGIPANPGPARNRNSFRTGQSTGHR
jgi:hypothetical protein